MSAMSRPPKRGEVCWADFDPRLGHEQGGRRPALILSSDVYNARTGLVVCCPITRKQKGYATEVGLPEGLTTRGCVLASHVYTLDWNARAVEFIEVAPVEVLEEVLDKLIALLEV
jgi:mRNA interferase MazF